MDSSSELWNLVSDADDLYCLPPGNPLRWSSVLSGSSVRPSRLTITRSGPTLKTAVFGWIIGTVSCFFGYTVNEGSAGVRRASTNSVVLSSLLIILSDVILVKIIFFLFPETGTKLRSVQQRELISVIRLQGTGMTSTEAASLIGLPAPSLQSALRNLQSTPQPRTSVRVLMIRFLRNGSESDSGGGVALYLMMT